MYREDLDGLRALAVLPVVLFHAGFGLLSGGYVGVDVFFVISGYLITDHLYKEVQGGRIDIARFYERRIRRIFPAFFFVVASVLIAGLFLLLPLELTDLSKSALAATFSVSNFWFYFDSGYFSAAAETKPLLHTWSLAVEEQFYLLWPPALWLLYRFARHRLLLVTLVLCGLSLGLNAVMIQISPSATFYMLPTRAWEMLAGAALAISSYRPQRHREAIAAIGAALIVVPMLVYTADTLFPGLAAVPVVLGTVLVIASAENTAVGRFLSTTPMRGVGLISYSLYLWHWPPLALANLHFGEDVPLEVSLLCIVLAIIMAAVSWRFIEQPFRRPAVRTIRPHRALLGGAVATATFAACAVALLSGMPNRLPANVASVAEVAALPDLSRTPCFWESGSVPTPAACLAVDGDDRTANLTVLWGDSHGPPFAAALRSEVEDLRVLGRAGCMPLIGFAPYRFERIDTVCAEFNEEVFAELVASPHVKTVILAGRWARLFFPDDDFEAQRLVASGDDRLVSPETALRSSFHATIEGLERSGKKVIVIGGVPEFTTALPECLARAMWLGLDATLCSHHRETLPGSVASRTVRAIAEDFPMADFIWPRETLCRRGTCMRTLDGLPVTRDTDHLTEEAAEAVLQATSPRLISAVSAGQSGEAVIPRRNGAASGDLGG
jgi:peptidoglycan/LPS O-acetylase OafA/YrhL